MNLPKTKKNCLICGKSFIGNDFKYVCSAVCENKMVAKKVGFNRPDLQEIFQRLNTGVTNVEMRINEGNWHDPDIYHLEAQTCLDGTYLKIGANILLNRKNEETINMFCSCLCESGTALFGFTEEEEEQIFNNDAFEVIYTAMIRCIAYPHNKSKKKGVSQ